MENIISHIDNNKYPYLKIIIVENNPNVRDKVFNNELNRFLNNNPNIERIKISLQTRENLDYLLNKIYNIINSDSPENLLLPINKITKYASEELDIKDCEDSISLLLVGDSEVGKTNFMTRYIMNNYNDRELDTIGIDREIKTLKINNENYKLTILDTSGKERLRTLTRKYYNYVDGILLFFDITDRNSFEEVTNWMNDIHLLIDKKENNEVNEKIINDIVIYLIGNKIDIIKKEEEIIYSEEKDELAKKLGVKYYEVSCKWNLNIEEVMARIIFDSYKNKLKRKNIFIKPEEDFITKTSNFEKLNKYLNF